MQEMRGGVSCFMKKKSLHLKGNKIGTQFSILMGYFCHKYIRGLQIGRNNTRYQWVGIHYLFESVGILEFMIQEQDSTQDQVSLCLH
jgi:hypothetical protein